jgi:peptide/nickel transport system permease protein
MSRIRWYLASRLFWMLATAWLVLSVAFVLFTVKPDPNIALVAFGAGPSAEAQQEAIQAYKVAHNYDVPVLQRYAKWMFNYATLQWGTTLQGVPIAALIGHSLRQTLTYLVPALLLSTVTAHALGIYMALHRGGLLDKLGNAIAYAGYGVPAFFAAEMAFGVLVHKYGMLWIPLDTARAHEDVFVPMAIDEFLLPGLILTGHLIAIQLVFIRSEVIEQLNADFMKTLLASGAGPIDLARHALRNAAIPLLSAFSAQILTILYLDIIAIEVAIGPGGFGELTFSAFTNEDVGLILGVAIVPIMVGLIGNFGQDFAYSVLDPRVEYAGSSLAGAFTGLRNRVMDLRPRTMAVGVVVTLVVIGAAAFFTAGFGALIDGGADTTDEIPTQTPEPGIQVRIGYGGEWQLHLEVTSNGTMNDRSLSGTGSEVVDIDPNTSRIRATVEKRDDSSEALTVQLTVDGAIVALGTAPDEYDTVQVSESF